MRLKYHLELETEGVLILESEPQIRNIFIYSQMRSTTRVALPYIQFVVRYIKKNGKIYFPGVWGSGLRIYGTLSPLTSMQDEVFLLPTDKDQGGYVCTDHRYDMKRFATLEEMVRTVISFWWNTRHNIFSDNIKQLQDISLDDLKNVQWTEPKVHGAKKPCPAFWDALKAGYATWTNQYLAHGVPSFDTNIPIDGIIIDEPWDNKKIEFVLVEATEPVKRKRGRPKKNET